MFFMFSFPHPELMSFSILLVVPILSFSKQIYWTFAFSSALLISITGKQMLIVQDSSFFIFLFAFSEQYQTFALYCFMMSRKLSIDKSASIYSQFLFISQMYRSIDFFIYFINYAVQLRDCFLFWILSKRALLSQDCFSSIQFIKLWKVDRRFAKYQVQLDYSFFIMNSIYFYFVIKLSKNVLTLFLKIQMDCAFSYSMHYYRNTLLVQKFGISSTISDCTDTTERLFVIISCKVYCLAIRMVLTYGHFVGEICWSCWRLI